MSATRKETTFRLEIAVEVQIPAPPAAVWARLTNAADFPNWNSTVGRIGGTIAAGQRLEIEVPSAPGRVFKPTVVTFEPPRRMVWQDGFAPMFQGTRTFTLEGPESGPTTFRMEEVFRGMMLPLIKGSLPDMCVVFDRYAADLRAACVG
jgi:uncharacterized protein YndB with AHSA1/START domain